MTETVAKWDDTVGRGRTNLRPVAGIHVRLEEFRAAVRAAGEHWTGGAPGELVDALARAAGDDPELVELVRSGGALLADFLDGLRQQAAPRDLAADLIAGRPVPPEVFDRLAARYLVVVVRSPDADGRPALHEAVLTTRHDGDLVLLVPAEDADRVTGRLTQSLGGQGLLATATRPREDIADGFREATDVLRLVTAGRRPSGAYALSDVLVEYAVTSHKEVTDSLVAVIEPLRAHALLWDALTALIDADFSRNRAAKNLFIHRSTLDYRLQRIAHITGCDPTSGRGMQVLTAAYVADAVR
ncbi:PucR family transcriptional regulator [Lentzea tibetensis]|uniref:PucR family transcriptional regulator n=1 Tax=Lentzea tibetensis TaxID=2591470 RepID=A0A563EJF0_9PSEU|nr:PucR family transcriptional regulator [Lentzea tibetensis]TWP46980.1 PucR family transcriptional regulator [Lentzea tibetensis]